MSEPLLLTFPELQKVQCTFEIRAGSEPEAFTAAYQVLTEAGAVGIRFGPRSHVSPVRVLQSRPQPEILVPVSNKADFWKSQDWKNKSVEQIAFETGKAISTVRSNRIALFGAFSPEVFRRPQSRANNVEMEARYGLLDWSKQDVVLAAEVGVSRERIRQLRVALNKPPSPIKKRHSGYAAAWEGARKWLEENRERVPFLTRKEAISESGFKSTNLLRWCKILGLEFRKGRHDAPYAAFNWELSSSDLAEIWKVRMQFVATKRFRSKLPFARFRHNSKKARSAEHQMAYDAEVLKASKYCP